VDEPWDCATTSEEVGSRIASETASETVGDRDTDSETIVKREFEKGSIGATVRVSSAD
jgi:hypothetical protein